MRPAVENFLQARARQPSPRGSAPPPRKTPPALKPYRAGDLHICALGPRFVAPSQSGKRYFYRCRLCGRRQFVGQFKKVAR